MRERDESNRTEFGLKRDHRTIENCPGGTHPGAEHGAVRGSLMLGMVPGMLDRLRLRQSADGKDAEHQEDRNEFEDAVVHQNMTQYDLVEF
jgi:hypothetical protein